MNCILFQKLNSGNTVSIDITVTVNGEGLHVDHTSLDTQCFSVWVKDNNGDTLSEDKDCDSILQRSIISAIENGGKLDI